MVAEPFLIDKVLWSFRSRVHGDPGGSWGVHAEERVDFDPIDWTVTRTPNAPAVAQVVLDGNNLPEDHFQVIRGMMNNGNEKNRTFGLSCFRNDFKEEDQGDAIFFGPITAIDIQGNGPITIHAEDMMSLAKGILVGTHDIKQKTAQEILTICQEEWVRSYPRASALQFKGTSTARMDYKVDITDLKTLYDVLEDVTKTLNLNVYHDRSIDIQMDTKGQYGRPLKFQRLHRGEPLEHNMMQHTLAGSSLTRLFGPEAQPNVVRVAGGDNSEEGRKVWTTGFTPVNDTEFVTALAVQDSHGVTLDQLKASAASLVQRYKTPAITASIRYPWEPKTPAPRPGEYAEASVAGDFYKDHEDEDFYGKRVRGLISSVTISQDFYDIEITSEGGLPDEN